MPWGRCKETGWTLEVGKLYYLEHTKDCSGDRQVEVRPDHYRHFKYHVISTWDNFVVLDEITAFALGLYQKKEML